MGNNRMLKHIIDERGVLMDQASLLASGNAHRVETRDGEPEDVTDERLDIILRQVREIDSIIEDPSCYSDS